MLPEGSGQKHGSPKPPAHISSLEILTQKDQLVTDDGVWSNPVRLSGSLGERALPTFFFCELSLVLLKFALESFGNH